MTLLPRSQDIMRPAWFILIGHIEEGLSSYWPSLDPSSSLCIHQRFSPGFEFLVTLGPGWPGHQCTMGEAVRAWQCRDERIRSEAGPVIVRPGAENLHESPLAPNMMDRWSHMNNLCSLVSSSHVWSPIGWEICATSLLFMGGIQRWWGGVGGKPLAQFAWERLQMRVEMRVCHIALWNISDKLSFDFIHLTDRQQQILQSYTSCLTLLQFEPILERCLPNFLIVHLLLDCMVVTRVGRSSSHLTSDLVHITH